MKIILVLSFIMVNFFASAQDSIPKPFHQLGLSTSGLFYKKSYKVILSPYWEIIKKSHSFSVGPTILLSSEFDASDRKYPKLTGVQGSYKYSPFQATKRLDFFFHATLIVQRIMDEWNANHWNANNSKYEKFGYRNTELIINPLVGYGIMVNLYKNIAVQQSLGAGYFFSYIDGDEFNNPGNIEADYDYRPYGGHGIGMEVKLGVVYLLNH